MGRRSLKSGLQIPYSRGISSDDKKPNDPSATKTFNSALRQKLKNRMSGGLPLSSRVKMVYYGFQRQNNRPGGPPHHFLFSFFFFGPFFFFFSFFYPPPPPPTGGGKGNTIPPGLWRDPPRRAIGNHRDAVPYSFAFRKGGRKNSARHFRASKRRKSMGVSPQKRAKQTKELSSAIKPSDKFKARKLRSKKRNFCWPEKLRRGHRSGNFVS